MGSLTKLPQNLVFRIFFNFALYRMSVFNLRFLTCFKILTFFSFNRKILISAFFWVHYLILKNYFCNKKTQRSNAPY